MAQGSLGEWRRRTARRCCVVSGIACLACAPVLPSLLSRSAVWASLGVSLAGGASLVVAGAKQTPAWARGGLAAGTFLALSWVIGARWGWVPEAVLLSCVSVVLGALLLGRAAACFVVLAQVGVTLAGGQWVAAGFDAEALASIAPARTVNWVRVSLSFGFSAGFLAALLHEVSALTQSLFARATASRHLSEQRVARARQRRKRRIATEGQLRARQPVHVVGQLSRGLSHLLNNALTVVRGALDELASGPGHRARQAGEAISEAALRVGRSVRAFMVFSRAGGGSHVELDLWHCLQSSLEDLRVALPHDVSLRAQGMPGYRIEMAPGHLQQLVLNLVLNACDALRAGGEVRVTLQPPAEPDPLLAGPRQVELVVEDNGCGMTPRALACAKQTLFTTKDTRRHAGLGLTIACDVVERLEGVLRIESKLELGTRVRAVLPVLGPLPSAQRYPLLQASRLMVEAPRSHERPGASDDSPQPQAEGAPPAPEHADKCWRAEVVPSFARVTALSLCAALAFALLRGYRFASVEVWVACGLLACAAVAALPGSAVVAWRAALLTGGLAAGMLAVIAHRSYLVPLLQVGLMLSVAWAALLARPAAVLALIAASCAVLLAAGGLHGAGVLNADLSLLTPADPANWARVGVVVPLFECALALSVVAIVQRAERSVEAARRAEDSVRSALLLEEQEDKKVLALEQEKARSERLAAAGLEVGGVTHDLNNALQALIGAAADVAHPSLSAREAEGAHSELWKAYEHTRSIALQLSSVGEAPEVEPETLDLGACLAEARPALRTLLGPDIGLRLRTSTDCFVRVGESDFLRLLYNLVRNAGDSMGARGRVEVVLTRGRDVQLEVRDTGCGMSEAVQKRLFEPFFTTKQHGTGLGLHSVRGIALATHGRISVESTEGRGATLRVTWPRAAAASASERASDSPNLRSVARGKLLLVEDEPLVRAFMARILANVGYEVQQAADGAAARALIADDTQFVALCIDGVLAEVPTGELIRSFAQRNPGRPIVVCSGHLRSSLAQRGLPLDCVSLLSKPFEPQQLFGLLGG